MYIPAENFREEQPVEAVCHLTGERYVWVDQPLEELSPELRRGAVTRLPNRFFQHPWVMRKGNNQWKLLFVPPTPEPVEREIIQVEKLAEPDYSI